MLNRGASLDLACTDAFQLRRSVVADLAVGHQSAANGSEERTEICQGCGAFRNARIFRSLALECLPHGIRVFRERRNIEKFRGDKHRPRHPHTREPRIRISQRAEAKLRTRAQVGDRLAYQLEFGFQRGDILPRRQRLYGAPAGHARRRAADDFLQLVEFQKLFCGARHVDLKTDITKGTLKLTIWCGATAREVLRRFTAQEDDARRSVNGSPVACGKSVRPVQRT
jgi:hypothetical protein